MARLLFLVHGMGVHGADWVTPVVERLAAVAARYDRFAGGGFADAVTVVPVTYDHLVTDELARWRAAADELALFAQREGISLGPGAPLFDWLAGAAEAERAFFWSHVIDVVLYRYVPAVTKRVRLHVMHTLARTLTEHMTGGRIVEATVLAHSLGTAVAHDSLHLLGSLPLDGSEAFLSTNFAFKGFFALSNVSRVLQTAPGPYESLVFPRTAARPEGYLRRYVNVRHRLDPFPVVRPFRPVGWDAATYTDLEVSFLRGFDVHAATHYLDSPEVHIPLLNALVPRAVPDAERDAALAAYPRVEGVPCLDELEAFVQRARQLAALVAQAEDPKRLVIAGAQFLAAAREAADAC